MKLEPSPTGIKIVWSFFFIEIEDSNDGPDDVDELPNGDVVGDEELGLVEDGELLLAVVALDDDGDLGRVLLADGLHVLDA